MNRPGKPVDSVSAPWRMSDGSRPQMLAMPVPMISLVDPSSSVTSWVKASGAMWLPPSQSEPKPCFSTAAARSRASTPKDSGTVDQIPVGPRLRRRAVTRSLASGVVISGSRCGSGWSIIASCWV